MKKVRQQKHDFVVHCTIELCFHLQKGCSVHQNCISIILFFHLSLKNENMILLYIVQQRNRISIIGSTSLSLKQQSPRHHKP